MAAATLGSADSAQGIISIYNLSAVVTGSTFVVKTGVKAWWISNKTTTDAVTATFVASTGTFTITVANTPDLALFVVS